MMKPDAVVWVELLPTSNGGRAGATPEGQFGCVFEIGGDYFDCRLDLSGTGPLLPGGSASVPIAFVSADDVVPRLAVGTVFRLWEGRTIAEGRVMSIVALPNGNAAGGHHTDRS